jgi:hypothetical protein
MGQGNLLHRDALTRSKRDRTLRDEVDMRHAPGQVRYSPRGPGSQCRVGVKCSCTTVGRSDYLQVAEWCC